MARINRPKRFSSKIVKVDQLDKDTKHIDIEKPEGFEFSPGQFISLIFKKNGAEVRRSYSIASKPEDSVLGLCIKIIHEGVLTPLLDKLSEGDEVEAIGPMGPFKLKPESLDKGVVFVSAGTGIGPFRSMIKYLLEQGYKNKILLLAGYRNEENAFYDNEFEVLKSKYPNFHYQKILSNSEGYVQDLVLKNISKESHYYICGLRDMVSSVREILSKNGIPEENIFFERYN